MFSTSVSVENNPFVCGKLVEKPIYDVEKRGLHVGNMRLFVGKW